MWNALKMPKNGIFLKKMLDKVGVMVYYNARLAKANQ